MIEPKISIIVPVYKAERYLHKCVDSLLSQTFSDFEVILVDDGSPDRSGEICDEYVRQDSRVRVIHKRNGGVSSARNVGINVALGKWICFVDSDDYVMPCFLETFVLYGLSETNVLYMNSGFYVDNLDDGNLIYKGIPQTNRKYEESEFLYGEYYHMINSPCMKIFNRDVLKEEGIYFDTHLSLGEDHLFVLDYLLSKGIVSIKNVGGDGYRYVKDSGNESLTSRNVPYEQLLTYAVKSYEKRCLVLRKMGLCNKDFECFIKSESKSYILKSLLMLYKSSVQSKYMEYARIKKEYLENFKNIPCSRYCGIHSISGKIVDVFPDKIGFYLFPMSCKLFYYASLIKKIVK